MRERLKARARVMRSGDYEALTMSTRRRGGAVDRDVRRQRLRPPQDEVASELVRASDRVECDEEDASPKALPQSSMVMRVQLCLAV